MSVAYGATTSPAYVSMCLWFNSETFLILQSPFVPTMFIYCAVIVSLANVYVMFVPVNVMLGASTAIDVVALIFMFPLESIEKVHPILVLLSVIDSDISPSVGEIVSSHMTS